MMVFGNVLALSDSSCHVVCCEEMLYLLCLLLLFLESRMALEWESLPTISPIWICHSAS